MNIELENTSSLQGAIAATAEYFNVGGKLMAEHLRDKAQCDADEEWERLWWKGQSGYLRCRGEARRAAKRLIMENTHCTDREALESYDGHFREYGVVEEAVEAAIASLLQEQREVEQQQLAALRMQPEQEQQNGSLHQVRDQTKGKPATKAGGQEEASIKAVQPSGAIQAQSSTSLTGRPLVLNPPEEASPERRNEPQLADDEWRAPDRTSHAPNQTHQVWLEADHQAKSSAVEAIAVVSGRERQEVEQELTIQLNRFKGFAEAVRTTMELLGPKPIHATPPNRDQVSDAGNTTNAPCARAGQQAITPTKSTHASEHRPSGAGLFSGTESPVQFESQLSGSADFLEPFVSSNGPTSHPHPPTNFPPKILDYSKMSLRECYAQTLNDDSTHGIGRGENPIQYSTPIDRPTIWLDASPDPKCLSAGWSVGAYTNWKEAAEKRKAQGAKSRFITYISINMIDVICAMTRTQPSVLLKLSDEELTLKLDTKFNIAQETNLLMLKFIMPTRPATLSLWELHLPELEWGVYVTKWLKELRSQQDSGKDLEKYDLSDVFTQSIVDFKLLFDHARVLTKLKVRDLIASCSDYLQEEVIREQKSASTRKQQGLVKPISSDTAPKQDGKHQTPAVSKPALTHGNGAMTQRQARAFLTEAAAKFAKAPPSLGSRPEFLVEFTKLSFHDTGCEACGKWYKNAPEKRFPNPCSGKCQYEGHPALNRNYKTGAKWKYPGYCCSWKGMSDKDIPPETLARLQKYQANKRERGTTA